MGCPSIYKRKQVPSTSSPSNITCREDDTTETFLAPLKPPPYGTMARFWTCSVSDCTKAASIDGGGCEWCEKQNCLGHPFSRTSVFCKSLWSYRIASSLMRLLVCLGRAPRR